MIIVVFHKYLLKVILLILLLKHIIFVMAGLMQPAPIESGVGTQQG